MFRITRDPSSVSLIQCLAKINSNVCTVSVGMDVDGVMAAYLPVTVILAKHCITLPDDGSLVIRNMLEQF